MTKTKLIKSARELKVGDVVEVPSMIKGRYSKDDGHMGKITKVSGSKVVVKYDDDGDTISFDFDGPDEKDFGFYLTKYESLVTANEVLALCEAEFYVINSQNDIARSVNAPNIEAAAKEVQKLMSKDGSYWHENGWRSVQDKSGKQEIELVEP